MGIPMWKEPSSTLHRSNKEESWDPAIARRSAIRRRGVAASTRNRARLGEGGALDTPSAESIAGASTGANALTRSSQTFLDLLSERARVGSSSARRSGPSGDADRASVLLEAANRTLLGVLGSASDSDEREESSYARSVARRSGLHPRLDDMHGNFSGNTSSSTDDEIWPANDTSTDATANSSYIPPSFTPRPDYNWDEFVDEALDDSNIARTPRFPPAFTPGERLPPSSRDELLRSLRRPRSAASIAEGDDLQPPRRPRHFTSNNESAEQRHANLDVVQRGIARIRERQRARSTFTGDWAALRAEHARRGLESRSSEREQATTRIQERVRRQLSGLRRETDDMRRETADMAARMRPMTRTSGTPPASTYWTSLDGLGDRDRSLSPEIPYADSVDDRVQPSDPAISSNPRRRRRQARRHDSASALDEADDAAAENLAQACECIDDETNEVRDIAESQRHVDTMLDDGEQLRSREEQLRVLSDEGRRLQERYRRQLVDFVEDDLPANEPTTYMPERDDAS